MNLEALRNGRWLLEFSGDVHVLSGEELDELAELLIFRVKGVLSRDPDGGLSLIGVGGNGVHVAFSDEADELLDSLRAQSILNPVDGVS